MDTMTQRSGGPIQLRILTGTHAGASLDLAPGRYALGAGVECDVSISDWRFDPLTLSIEADGAVVASWNAGAPQALRFEDHVPVDFEGVVVCVGPVDAAWPEQARLLASARTVKAALAPPAPVQPSRRRGRRALMSWAGMVALALVSAGWLATATSKPSQRPLPPLSSVSSGLRADLDRSLGPRLQVRVDGGAVVVEGLLDDEAQARIARTALQAVPAGIDVVSRISVATELAETIRTSVGLPGARIDYRGDGVFTFSGRTTDVAATQALVTRVAADLAPVVRRIDAVLEEPDTRPPMPAVLSAMAADDVTVMETRDGIKHVVVTQPGAGVPAPLAEVRPGISTQ